RRAAARAPAAPRPAPWRPQHEALPRGPRCARQRRVVPVAPPPNAVPPRPDGDGTTRRGGGQVAVRSRRRPPPRTTPAPRGGFPDPPAADPSRRSAVDRGLTDPPP